jgi:hypothetical protein
MVVLDIDFGTYRKRSVSAVKVCFFALSAKNEFGLWLGFGKANKRASRRNQGPEEGSEGDKGKNEHGIRRS